MGQVESQSQSVKIYLVTELGTLICLNFDFMVKLVTDVKSTTYIKDMVGFRIIKIQATENLQLCMLIEHDCMC